MIGTLRDSIKEVRLNIRHRNFQTAEEMLDEILDEFQDEEKEQEPSLDSLKVKVIKKMDMELYCDHIENVFKLSHVLEMLCSQV